MHETWIDEPDRAPASIHQGRRESVLWPAVRSRERWTCPKPMLDKCRGRCLFSGNCNLKCPLGFSRSLVRTTEDLGLQGDLPTNSELLDWLASWGCVRSRTGTANVIEMVGKAMERSDP